jgi:type IV secretory pathway ATPase VirB11/archaellum biosynthesis ATPase
MPTTCCAPACACGPTASCWASCAARAFAFLRAVNSGHPGSITTVHADSPDGAIDQIALLAMTSGLDLGWSRIQTYVRQVIDVIVQLDRQNGKRRVSDIQFLGTSMPPAAND